MAAPHNQIEQKEAILGIIAHLFYKTNTGGGVPSPVDGNENEPWPLDRWASQLPAFSASGITVPLLPPLTKGASLGAGLDIRDHYDVGSKNQSGRRQTRYGSREQGQRFCANTYANGMEPAVNIPDHHLDGDAGNYLYQYPGADGKTLNGRFPKDKNCFWIWSKEQPQNPDTVPVPQWDMSFGREFRWLSGTYGDGQGLNGPGYVGRNLIEAAKWQLRTFGIRQPFLDDLKGTNTNFIAWLCNTLWELGLVDFCWGEFFEGNRDILNNYVNSYPNMGSCGVLDFSIRFALQNWCNSPGRYDMRQLLWNGLHWINPTKAVTFVNDADTALSEPIWRVLQANAAICTMPGYPMIFGQDLYPAPEGYGILDETLNLCWINSMMAHGPVVVRAAEPDYLVYERPEAPGLLVGLGNRPGNYDNPNDWTPVTVQTAWWPGTWIHDYTGHTNDSRVGPNQEATIWVPPVDDSGRAFTCLGQHGIGGSVYLPPRPTHQTFCGTEDLDTAAATPEGTRVTHIWSEARGTLDLSADQGHVDYEVTDEYGNTVIPRGNWQGEAKVRGWHRMTAYSKTGGAEPYAVNSRYWGTTDLRESEYGDPLELRAPEPITIHTDSWLDKLNDYAAKHGVPESDAA